MRSLIARAERARREREPLRLEFVGACGTGKRGVASALASALDLELLVVDAKRLAASAIDAEQVLALAVRDAWFRDALLYVRNADALREDARLPLERLTAALADYPGLGIIASTSQLPVDASLRGALRWSFGVPPAEVRERLWSAALERHDGLLEPGVSRSLAERFRLIPADIDGAAALARARSSLNEAGRVSAVDLFNAAREQRGAALEQLAVRTRPTRSWNELVLPGDQQAQLRELCERAAQHRFVLDDWDFASKLPRGRGINALFAGPSGTGKTMAAEVIASALGVDLWRIDLASVVSKYIGETEKNLDRIFSAAESANGVLLFDEAEALFGKRSEVRDSHDRYANIEVAYLLQKMEQFDGIAILATNLRGNLDEAFVRRLAFSVHFPVPDESSRRRIWDGIFPSPLPLGDDVDFDQLARDVQLTGGHIHNIALAAAYLAAADGRVVTMSHLLEATRREYQKLGKHVPAAPLAITAT
jgi:SpoVK/Ycf46/Vps4 family AAA+-type ATPase